MRCVRCAPWGATTCTTSPTHESRTSSVFSFSSSHNLCRRPCSYVVFTCLLLPRVISSIFISSSPARFSWAFFLVSSRLWLFLLLPSGFTVMPAWWTVAAIPPTPFANSSCQAYDSSSTASLSFATTRDRKPFSGAG